MILSIILAWYALLSLLTLILYWIDKRKAQHQAWRIKENTLHTFELLGGWPGGILAQRWFHHKSRKQKYQLAFWAIVAVHLIAWGLWIFRSQL
jgi:uncharacterized membrane protein YsdA (DUF1294 family)